MKEKTLRWGERKEEEGEKAEKQIIFRKCLKVLISASNKD